jgi:Mg2+-importing ATPase
LREADVGISVDTGADLAKDTADLILTEKNLRVIYDGINIGRRTHGNTIKYIKVYEIPLLFLSQPNLESLFE